MSKYVKKTTIPLKSLFYKRTKYYRKSITARTEGAVSHNNLINYHLAELNMYGKVDQQYVPMIVRQSALQKFNSKVLVNPDETHQAVDFVVDLFEQMAQQFEKCAMIGKINPNDPILSNLKVYKAYTNPTIRYDQYFGLMANTLKTQLRKRGIVILTMDDFMSALLQVLPDAALQAPFTQVAWTKSKYCPSRVSGLVVEIADLGYNNDQEKIDLFYNSLNWDFYVKTCNSYGFIVDSSAPWRLLADLDSKIMMDAQSRAGHASGVTGTLGSIFRSVPVAYISRFEKDLYNLFLVVRSPHTTTPAICAYSNELSPLVTYAPSYTFGEFNSLKSAEYYIKTYCQIRFLEEESHFTPAEQLRLIDDCIGVMRTGQINVAIKNFEYVLNKPFDYIGSVSYNNKYARAKDEYERKHGGDWRETEREVHRIKARRNLK